MYHFLEIIERGWFVFFGHDHLLNELSPRRGLCRAWCRKAKGVFSGRRSGPKFQGVVQTAADEHMAQWMPRQAQQRGIMCHLDAIHKSVRLLLVLVSRRVCAGTEGAGGECGGTKCGGT